MNHSKHLYLMIGLLAVGAVLVFSGSVNGGVLFLLWPLACIAMMFVMMRGMGGMKHGTDHTHDDGVTHSHDDVPTHSQR